MPTIQTLQHGSIYPQPRASPRPQDLAMALRHLAADYSCMAEMVTRVRQMLSFQLIAVLLAL